jgi:hypothetical protein
VSRVERRGFGLARGIAAAIGSSARQALGRRIMGGHIAAFYERLRARFQR